MKTHARIRMPAGDVITLDRDWRSSTSEPEPDETAIHTAPGPPCFFCGETKTDIELAADHLGPSCGPCFRRWRAH